MGLSSVQECKSSHNSKFKFCCLSTAVHCKLRQRLVLFPLRDAISHHFSVPISIEDRLERSFKHRSSAMPPLKEALLGDSLEMNSVYLNFLWLSPICDQANSLYFPVKFPVEGKLHCQITLTNTSYPPPSQNCCYINACSYFFRSINFSKFITGQTTGGYSFWEYVLFAISSLVHSCQKFPTNIK